MPAVNLSTLPTQVFSNAGKPGAGYKLFTYDAGSFSTLKAAYADEAGTVVLPNPIVADSSGRLPVIWLMQDETYNVALTMPDGTTVIQTWVDIQGAISFSAVQDVIDSGVFLPLSGGTVTGSFAVNGVTNLLTTTIGGTLTVTGPTNLQAVTAASVTASLNANNQRLTNVATPTGGTDAANKTYVDTNIVATTMPAGIVSYTAAATAPTGWLIANGDAVSRTTYAALFAAIGTTYGSGDSSTTFNLPDLRGVFARGLDLGRGLDAGRVLGSYQADEFASHTHTLSTTDDGWNNGVTRQSDRGINGSVTTSPAGGSETRPKNLALTPLIKT